MGGNVCGRSPFPATPPFRALKRVLCHAGFAAGILLILVPVASGQLASLDKGHQLLVNSGLQIWGCDTGASPFAYSGVTGANMDAAMWSFEQAKAGSLSAGQRWGKWVQPDPSNPSYTAPGTSLTATESAHYADLVAIQVGDEQQGDLENPNGYTRQWFDAARTANNFNDKLLYVNSTFVNDIGNFFNFIGSANPDALSWDAYPFGTTGVYPYNWLGKAQIYRRAALGSYIGASGNAARPYGLYLQTYHAGDGARDPSDLEMRWQQFTAWTMGYTFVDTFSIGGGTSLFNGGNMGSPTQPRYDQFAETARQGKNLGPALTKLISYGYGPDIALGRNSDGSARQPPIDWPQFSRSHAPQNQQYLTAVSAQNLGTKNGGQPGDVYIGYFNPLLASYGDPAGTAYFMVTNALGADLQDPSLLVTDCTQRITLDFDFGASAINSLERMRRSDGLVEVVPLTHLSGSQYRLTFDLEGGTGDLFKYNDGTPFIGGQAPILGTYWDSDGTATNNNLATGSGLGGSGTWDSSGAKWYSGTSDGAWTTNSNAVFSGTAGTVTLSTPQSAANLIFKSNGYTIAGSTLTMTGATITTDLGVSATINSTIAGTTGLVKNGPGTLNLASSNSYTGGTTVDEGVLGIVSGSLGASPPSPATNVTINNGAMLRFNVNNLTLSSTRNIVLGSSGGVVDTNGNNDTIAGAISGTTLTKTGAGALALSNINSHSSTIVSGGSLQVSSDANLGAVPASFTTGNFTLNGGALQFGASFDPSNNRGITVGTGGGTIDTQSFSNPTGYNATAGGFSGPGDLTKIGSGTFFAAATSGGANTTWKGKLIIKQGTWKIVATDGLPYNAPTADGLEAAQVTLDGGTWQIGANVNATSARRGVTIAAGGGTVDTQNFNLTWAGPWAGSTTTAVLSKVGSGQLQLNSTSLAPGSYAGTFNINGGTVILSGGTAMGDLAAINLADTAGVGLSTLSSETIGSLSGGGSSGGNVTLPTSSAFRLTTGGNNGSTTFNGLITGAGGLNKVGAGTFTLGRSSGNTYSDTTGISAGKLLVNNTTGSGTGSGQVIVSAGGMLGGTGIISGAVTVVNGGHIAPGVTIESLDVGTLNLGSTFYLDFDLDTIGGVDVGDLINVTSTNGLAFTSSGTLNIVDAGHMTGGIYTLIDYSGTFSGSANSIGIGTAPMGFTYRIFNDPTTTSFKIEVTAPGDFNHDGTVDAADYVTWRKNGGSSADYDSWRAHFGQTYTPGNGATSAAVPEPTGWILLCFGCVVVLRKRAS
jgi:autotransporter-associated beta strand protein